MTAALFAVSIFPREWIQSNSEESARQLMRIDSDFYNLTDGSIGREELRIGDYSKVDQYADSLSLNMAYYIDPSHPLKSALLAQYYDGIEYKGSLIKVPRKIPLEKYQYQETAREVPLKTMNESYARSVKGGTSPNRDYLRYWHGSLIIIRPMLIFWNYMQMKTILGIMMGLLLAFLLILLVRHRFRVEAVCIAIAMISVSIWYVPLSLEYIWMFLLMLVISIIAVKWCVCGKIKNIPLLLFQAGMLAAFFDFFTTETITLLIPLLLVIRIVGRRGEEKELWRLAAKGCVIWGIGYAGCWTAKWVLSAIVFRQNISSFVGYNILLHMGALEKAPVIRQIYASLLKNIWPRFPLGYGRIGAMLFAIALLVFIFIPVFQGRIVLRKAINRKRILLYALLGALVYVRFIVLRDHVWMHFFFTYRAQAATVLSVCFIVPELIEYHCVSKDNLIAFDNKNNG